jgi:hypothetical protein
MLGTSNKSVPEMAIDKSYPTNISRRAFRTLLVQTTKDGSARAAWKSRRAGEIFLAPKMEDQ